jgi:L-lactate dehydrogenase complex protein LldG
VDQFRSALKLLKGESVLVETPGELSEAIMKALKANHARSAVIAGISPDLATRIKADLESGSETTAVIIDSSSSKKENNLEACNNAPAGITWAQYAIATSGALVEIVYDDIVKLASSLPGFHLALLPASGILPTVDQALETVGKVMSEKPGILPVISLISGPSKTSDIELKLLYGVHGPLALYVIILGWA